jgi:hypothetical protein
VIEGEPNLITEDISLQIQKIQTFLVCAEHFDSELVRKVFELFREKQFEGIPGRLILLGDNFTNIDLNHSIADIVDRLREVKGNSAANLTIVNVNSLEFHFEGQPAVMNPKPIDGIPTFIDN